MHSEVARSEVKLATCGKLRSRSVKHCAFSPQRGGKAVKKKHFPRFFHTAKKCKKPFLTPFPRQKCIIRHSFPHNFGKLCGKICLKKAPSNCVNWQKIKKFYVFFDKFYKSPCNFP